MIWLLYFPVAVLTYILCLITNPLIILLCDENGELEGIWHLWQTWDDSCDSEYFMTHICPDFLNYGYYEHYDSVQIPLPYNRVKRMSLRTSVPLSPVGKIQRYFCRLWWLTRNCAYGFAYEWLSKDVNGADVKTIYKGLYTAFYYDPVTHAWMLRSEKPIIDGYLRWEVLLGWKIALGSKEPTKSMIATRAVLRIE